MRVRDPRDADLSDRRVGRDDFLDLPRPDLKAARLDEILLAIDDGEIPVAVERPQVAGIEATPAEHLLGGRRILPAAFHALPSRNGDPPSPASASRLARITGIPASHCELAAT